MEKICCIKTCTTTSTNSDGTCFYRFPTKEKMQLSWFRAILEHTGQSVFREDDEICSKHFSTDCFVKRDGVLNLKASAIPFGHLESENGEENIAKKIKIEKPDFMIQCSVFTCANIKKETEILKSNIIYYPFPRNGDLAQKWKVFCNKIDDDFDNSYICSDHFIAEDFVDSAGNMLKKDVIPTIYKSEIKVEEPEILDPNKTIGSIPTYTISKPDSTKTSTITIVEGSNTAYANDLEMADDLSGYNWRNMSEEQKEHNLRRLMQDIFESEGNESDRPGLSDDEEQNYVSRGDDSDEEMELVVEGLSDFDVSEDEDILDELRLEYDVAHQEQQLSEQYFLGRDGTKWRKQPLGAGRIRAHNIVRETDGLKCKINPNPLDIFKSIITEEMVVIIIRETNRKAASAIPNWKLVTEQELYAYFGILLAAGVNHANMQDSFELWKTNKDPVFRATMPITRFWAINRFIRFDDQRTRAERQRTDKAAAIRDIWTILNNNLDNLYTPESVITVNEQLFPFRGKTKFTQFIPSKPAKYGIKVWWACDSSNGYPCKGILYTGKESGKQRKINQSERMLLELIAKYKLSGRTVIADKFFTTLEAVEKLRTAGMGFVGTVSRSKKYIPKEMLPHRSRPIHSTEFGFANDISLLSYVPKKNKAFLLLSSIHYDTEVVGETRKPQAILFYNKHKGGVDMMDQILGEYSCNRQTKRWPLAIFYNILDVAALASYIIYQKSNVMSTEVARAGARRKFLHFLIELLVSPQIELRMKNLRIISKFTVKNAIESFFGAPLEYGVPQPSTSQTTNKRKSCNICRINDKLQRKTRFYCVGCAEPVCFQHSLQQFKCHKCINVEQNK